MRMFFPLCCAMLWTAATGVATPQGQQTANLTVSAHVVRNCIINVYALDFGTYDPLVTHKSQPLDGQASLVMACTKGTAANVEIDDGSNAQGSTRRLAAGSEFLAYELYTDAGHTSVWGEGAQARQFASSAFTVSSASSGVNASATYLYGRIAAGQNVAPGDYGDTATVTINF